MSLTLVSFGSRLIVIRDWWFLILELWFLFASLQFTFTELTYRHSVSSTLYLSSQFDPPCPIFYYCIIQQHFWISRYPCWITNFLIGPISIVPWDHYFNWFPIHDISLIILILQCIFQYLFKVNWFCVNITHSMIFHLSPNHQIPYLGDTVFSLDHLFLIRELSYQFVIVPFI